MDSKAHWEHIYETKTSDQVSWFEPEATLSLALAQRAAPTRDEAIIDVGAGAGTFVDGLLSAGYRRITVLDLSAAALAQAQHRLGGRAQAVVWRDADVLTAAFPARAFDVWHDRAVFHFLTRAPDRRAYVAQVRRALRPGGFVIVASLPRMARRDAVDWTWCAIPPIGCTRSSAMTFDFSRVSNRRTSHRGAPSSPSRTVCVGTNQTPPCAMRNSGRRSRPAM